MDTDKHQEAADTVKWALTRLDWYTVQRLREALAVLGAEADPVLLDLVRGKYRRKTGKEYQR
jgi:hypothetical protein